MIGRMSAYRLLTIPLFALLGASLGCSGARSEKTETEAKAFLTQANDTLLRLGNESSQAGWVQNTYINARHRGDGCAGERSLHDGRNELLQAGAAV
jgi:hypothetical protein